jgi:excinuclease UvrABC ATPase subunit
VVCGQNTGEIWRQKSSVLVRLKHKSNTITTQYFEREEMKFEGETETGREWRKFLKLTGATGNNLRHVSVELPLGKDLCDWGFRLGDGYVRPSTYFGCVLF